MWTLLNTLLTSFVFFKMTRPEGRDLRVVRISGPRRRGESAELTSGPLSPQDEYELYTAILLSAQPTEQYEVPASRGAHTQPPFHARAAGRGPGQTLCAPGVIQSRCGSR